MKDISKELLFQVANVLLSLLSGVAVGAYLAKYLGAENQGVVSLYVTVWVVLTTLTDFGTNQFIVKEFSNKSLVRTNFFWNVMLFVRFPIAIFLSLIFYFFIKNRLSLDVVNINCFVILVGVVSVAIFPISQFSLILSARMQNRKIAFGTMLITIITSVIKIVVVKLELSIDSLFLIHSFGVILGLVNSLYWVSKFSYFPKWHFESIGKLKELVRKSFPLFLATMVSLIFAKVDLFMIDFFLNVKYLGIYSISSRLFDLTQTFALVTVNTLRGPIFSVFDGLDDEEIMNYLEIFLRFLTFFSYIVIIICTIAGLILVPFIYGEEYKDAALPYVIRCMALPFILQTQLRLIYLVNREHTSFHTYSLFFGCAINIVFNFTLIPLLGIVGASLATLVGQFFYSLLSSRFYKERSLFKIQIKSYIPKPHQLVKDYKVIRTVIG